MLTPGTCSCNLRRTACASDSARACVGPMSLPPGTCTCKLPADTARAMLWHVQLPAELAPRENARASRGRQRSCPATVHACFGGRRVRQGAARAEFRRKRCRPESGRPSVLGARLRPAAARLARLGRLCRPMTARLAWLDRAFPQRLHGTPPERTAARHVMRNARYTEQFRNLLIPSGVAGKNGQVGHLLPWADRVT